MIKTILKSAKLEYEEEFLLEGAGSDNKKYKFVNNKNVLMHWSKDAWVPASPSVLMNILNGEYRIVFIDTEFKEIVIDNDLDDDFLTIWISKDNGFRVGMGFPGLDLAYTKNNLNYIKSMLRDESTKARGSKTSNGKLNIEIDKKNLLTIIESWFGSLDN